MEANREHLEIEQDALARIIAFNQYLFGKSVRIEIEKPVGAPKEKPEEQPEDTAA